MTTELDEQVAKFRWRIGRRTEEIKSELVAHIERQTYPVNDGTSITNALLELAFDRFLSLHENAEEVQFLVNSALRRAVDRWKRGMI